ncbi:MAG: hypothetical protein AAB594_03610 [Patescibacteria group bacterium]
MKVKIFTGAAEGTVGFQHLEEEVNTWLNEISADFKHFTAVSRHVSTCSGVNIEGNAFVDCTIAIFYTT